MRSAGYTLTELLVVTGLMALIAASAALPLAIRPLATRDAAERLAALVDAGRALAATGGDGATIALTPRAGGGFVATLYRNRPTPAASLAPANVEPYASSSDIALEGVAQAPPLAIFIDSGGGVSAARWAPGMAALVSEPVCSGRLNLTLRDGARVLRRSIPCNAAALR